MQLRSLSVAAALLAWGCAHAPVTARPVASHRLADAPVVVEADEAIRPQVDEAVRRSLPRIAAWGTLREVVHVRVHPTHEALERAVDRVGFPWLRAWARYDSVDVQDARTWGLLKPPAGALLELLTHELTHCLMYQRIGNAESWRRKGVPLWFREGMASVTAEQGYRRMTVEELSRHLRTHPGLDPLSAAEALVQNENDLVYGAAHRAFAFLLSRHGQDTISALLDRMGSGDAFDSSFKSAIGISHDDFKADFLNYLRWEGWRKAR